MKNKAIEILTEQGAKAAVDFLNAQTEALKTAQAYNEVVRHAYWQMYDLDATVTLAKNGIAYAAQQAKGADEAQAAELNDQVKAMAYNLASFTWPGWDEDWIEDIPAEYLKLGLDAAHTNVHLAQELEKGDLALSRAYWMLAAQQIAAKDYAQAAQNFDTAIEYAEKAKAHSDVLLSHGFVHVTALIQTPEDEEALSGLEAIKAELVKLEHGESFVQQLEAALRVFS